MTRDLQQGPRVPGRGAAHGLAVGIATWLIIFGFLLVLGGGAFEVGGVEVALMFFASIFAGVFAAWRPHYTRQG